MIAVSISSRSSVVGRLNAHAIASGFADIEARFEFFYSHFTDEEVAGGLQVAEADVERLRVVALGFGADSFSNMCRIDAFPALQLPRHGNDRLLRVVEVVVDNVPLYFGRIGPVDSVVVALQVDVEILLEAVEVVQPRFRVLHIGDEGVHRNEGPAHQHLDQRLQVAHVDGVYQLRELLTEHRWVVRWFLAESINLAEDEGVVVDAALGGEFGARLRRVKAPEDGLRLPVGGTVAQPADDEGELWFQVITGLSRIPTRAEGFQQAGITSVAGAGHTAQVRHIQIFACRDFERRADGVRCQHQAHAIVDDSGMGDVFRHRPPQLWGSPVSCRVLRYVQFYVASKWSINGVNAV